MEEIQVQYCGTWKSQTDHDCNVKLLEYKQKYEDLVCCLMETSTKKSLWSLLAHALNQLDGESQPGRLELTQRAFAEAKKVDGVVPPVIKEWNFLGPFPIGKTEVDGDPVAHFGGAHQALKQSLEIKHIYRSELVSGGTLSWTKLKADKNGQVHVSPAVNWGDLVSSLGSTGITEWQGWSVGEFFVNQKSVILFQCLGVHTIYIDNSIVAADIYRRDWFWFSIQLSVGLHTISIRLRTKIQQTYQCQLKQSGKLRFELHQPHFVPDIVEEQLITPHIALPIVNHAVEKSLKDFQVTITDQSGFSPLSVSLVPANLKPSVVCGQVSILHLILKSQSASKKKHKCQEVMLTVKVSSAGTTQSQQVSIKLRCRNKKQSFVFTFEDHDGSIQHAAAIAPKKKCPPDGCPVVLTLHGTGVPAENQADSYKRMKGKNWVFGLDTAWILAPTRWHLQ